MKNRKYVNIVVRPTTYFGDVKSIFCTYLYSLTGIYVYDELRMRVVIISSIRVILVFVNLMCKEKRVQ